MLKHPIGIGDNSLTILVEKVVRLLASPVWIRLQIYQRWFWGSG